MTAGGPISTLDGLRAIAVSLVMLLHFGYLNGGWIGVQVFFVLSGFLITGVLLADREAPLGDYLRRFYWRRTLRIFPLYYAYLALLALSYAAWGRPAEFPRGAPTLLTYTYNFTRLSPEWEASPFFTHFWSLAVEEQFYLAWPFVVHALSRRALVALGAALVALGPVFRWALASGLAAPWRSAYDVGDSVYWFPFSHADAFATGALVALLGLGGRVRRPAPVALAAVAALAAAGVVNLRALRAAGVDLPLGTMGFPLASIENGIHAWGYTLLNLCSAALVAAAVAAHREGGVVSGLAYAPLAGLGRISYGVYVLHWPLLVLFNASVRYRGMTLRGALMCAAWAALVFAAAWLSYRFYESRLLALKDRGWGRRGAAAGNGRGPVASAART
jgi:peptidoglycan/LPS O-acetylase OafA/YrhL